MSPSCQQYAEGPKARWDVVDRGDYFAQSWIGPCCLHERRHDIRIATDVSVAAEEACVAHTSV